MRFCPTYPPLLGFLNRKVFIFLKKWTKESKIVEEKQFFDDGVRNGTTYIKYIHFEMELYLIVIPIWFTNIYSSWSVSSSIFNYKPGYKPHDL